MKKALAILLSLTLLLSAGCTSKAPQATEPIETTAATQPTEPTKPGAEVITDEVKAQFDTLLEQKQFQGITYLTYNGQVVYQSVSGTNDLGEPLTIDSPMYIGSISKQFCAAAILMLRDQGKLSLDDTLAVYFPEYTIGKDITLKNLLTMHSGIVRDVTPMWLEPELYMNQTKEENIASFQEWVFQQPLMFEPGAEFFYCNVNYTLLSLIVEAVSGQEYDEFIRQNILIPLGMNSTGFVGEIKNTPDWAKGLTYDNVQAVAQLPMAIQGCGDLISTAADMDAWMNALPSGEVICQESYREMTTMVGGYGYGLTSGLRGGVRHGGGIGTYASMMYINEEYGYNLFMVTGNASTYRPDVTEKALDALLGAVYTAVDAASK